MWLDGTEVVLLLARKSRNTYEARRNQTEWSADKFGYIRILCNPLEIDSMLNLHKSTKGIDWTTGELRRDTMVIGNILWSDHAAFLKDTVENTKTFDKWQIFC